MNKYISPENYHRHQYKFCNYVWEHHDCNDITHGDMGHMNVQVTIDVIGH